MGENENKNEIIDYSFDDLESVSGGKDIIGNTFTQISKSEASSGVKKGEPIVYLDQGYYKVNNSIRFFNDGFYRVSK